MSETLRGIVLREERDTLVVRATPEEVVRFAVGDQVDVARRAKRAEDAFLALRPGLYLYDRTGREVLLVDETSIEREEFDITGFGDTARRFVAGAAHVHLRGRLITSGSSA